MTDVAAPAPPPARRAAIDPAAAKARVRARYRAEMRFRAYGIAAIVFAAAFIVFLVGDILVKGLPAFIEHRLVLEVTPTAEAISDGLTDPAALRSGNFDAPIREALGKIFPEVTSRAQRSRLYGDLLSSGAGDALRRRVLDNPAVLGTTFTVPVLLSSSADLYFKGSATAQRSLPARGGGVPSDTTGDITIHSSANDFSAGLVEIRRDLLNQARHVLREVEALERALPGVAADQRETLAARIKELRDMLADTERRASATGGSETLDDKLPSQLVAINGGLVKLTSIGSAEASGTVLVPLASTAEARPGAWRLITLDTPETNRKLTDQQIAWLDTLSDKGLVERAFATRFFTSGDSREPEQAGLLGGLIGSALTMLVTLALCLPLGVGAAIYLEEFAPKNRLSDLIEVNINNLAAVPSIVFGLLGLAMFLNVFGMPRSAPLVGGLVLALLVLPTIIIASRAALKAVPPSIREAALGIGASHQQAVFHHVLPLAMPGIMTGTIIGMAHALGETAPLLLIGMVAFIVDVPHAITDAATVMPVQIFLWSDLPEPGFQAKTAGAIIVLLLFLFLMNGAAILLRRRFERRW